MRVYVAGPYTKGDVVENVRAAILAGTRVLDAGHTPWIPHLNHLWHMVSPHPPADWYAYDLEWLPLCEALIRISGESWGADREVERAQELGIPVFHGVEAFLEAVKITA